MAPDPLGLQTVGVAWLATSEGGGVPVEYLITIHHHSHIQTDAAAVSVTAHQTVGIPF